MYKKNYPQMDLEFTKLIISKELIPSNLKDTKEVGMNFPKICPICGSKEIFKEDKVRNSSVMNLLKEKHKSILIPICKEHSRFKRKIFLYSLFFILTFVISIFLISESLEFPLNLIILAPVILCCYSLAILIVTGIILNGLINFEIFPEGYIISVKNDEWISKFKQINSCDELVIDEKSQDESYFFSILFLILNLALIIMGVFSISILFGLLLIIFGFIIIRIFGFMLIALIILVQVNKTPYSLHQVKINGPKISLFGGVILFLGVLNQLARYSDMWSGSKHIFDIRLSPLEISWIVALFLGVIALFGTFLALKEYKIGKYIILISGIVLIVGLFIPIGVSSYPNRLPCICPVYLVTTSFIFEPYLILIGGIITFYLGQYPDKDTKDSKELDSRSPKNPREIEILEKALKNCRHITIISIISGIILIILAIVIPWSGTYLEFINLLGIYLLILAGVIGYIYIKRPKRLSRIFVNARIQQEDQQELKQKDSREE